MVQFRVVASSTAPRLSLPKAWGCQSLKSGATHPPLGEAATPYGDTNNVTRNLTYMNHADFGKENCALLASISGSWVSEFVTIHGGK